MNGVEEPADKGPVKTAAFILTLLFATILHAQDLPAPQIEREPAAVPKNSKTFWNSLSPNGVEFSFVYKGELSRVLSGGVESQNAYLENLDIKLSIDAEKALN